MNKPACAILLLTLCSSAQKPPTRIHLDGAKALQLVSILASGGATGEAFTDKGTGKFVIHDLAVRTAATQKYDSDAPIYKLALRDAHGTLGDAKTSTPITEATALWEFFARLNLPGDAAMDGSYYELASVTCSIDTHADFASPKRAQCDLVNSF